ncbi:MAG: TlpA family protein disulfide reductase [Deltaproteobacteria bacterium]|nr:TlpA family protein disulfide reductase [Deltaproteobacteria bacterium]
MAMKRSLAVPAVLSLLLVLVAFPAIAQESKSGSYTKIPTVKGIEMLPRGTPAPGFVVRDLSDKEFRLKDCCGRDPVLLFFWSFFCGPCREEMPMINQMAKLYQGRGLHVIGVNLDGKEMKKAIEKFVANEKIQFRIVFDELAGDSFTVADPYGVAGTPALFLVDRKGVISFSVVGAVTADKLKKEIEKALK